MRVSVKTSQILGEAKFLGTVDLAELLKELGSLRKDFTVRAQPAWQAHMLTLKQTKGFQNKDE